MKKWGIISVSGVILVTSVLMASSSNNQAAYAEERISIRGEHPRSEGIWPQYAGLDTALRENYIFTDVIYPDSPFVNWLGKPVETHDLKEQNPDNYDSTHNHYQNILSEVWNFKPGANAVSIWGDSTAIANGTKAWGGFLSARSNYESFLPGAENEEYVPEGLDLNYEEGTYDTQLVGLEIDVLNGGKPGVYPNMAKTGLQVVGFGNPNSMAIEVRSEDTDKDVENRRGVWESGIYFKNSIADYGRLMVADIDSAKMGFDFRRSLFTEGIMQAKTNQVGTGIIYNEGKSGEIYGGDRWNGEKEDNEWLSLRAGTGGVRVVSQDNTKEMIAVDNHGGIYLNGDVYINGKKLNDLLELDDRVSKLEKEIEIIKNLK
ncbi:hypothetical protein [Paenibacillus urinalis]|uniref:hypothetical protein n=1 Tax=Paenibacillus urinalis TaxID=521520 RepID=UPI001961B6E9